MSVPERRFCAWCGGQLGPYADGRQTCAACGRALWFNGAPCCAVLVLDAADRVLLARRGIEPALGRWDTPGGFLQPYETPEDAAVRELLEEAGVVVAVDEVLGHLTDSYGPGGDPLLACVLTARIVDGRPQPADDVAELRWFALDALPARHELAFASTAGALGLLALARLG